MVGLMDTFDETGSQILRQLNESRLVTVPSGTLESMLDAEQRLNAALRAGEIGVWQFELPSLAVSRTDVTETLLDLDPGEFNGSASQLAPRIHTDDRAAFIAMVQSAKAGINDPDIDVRIVCRSGRIRWLHIKGRIIRDSSNEPVRVVGIVADVTEKKDREQVEQALRKSHRKLTSYIENTPMAVIEWDSAMRIRYWSSGAQKIFGFTSEEMLNTSFDTWQLDREEDRASLSASLNGLLTGVGVGGGRDLSLKGFTRTGVPVHCEWYNSALTDDTGAAYAVLSLVLDVTDRKRIEAQFLHSQKMEVLGKIAGGLAHDYNNLLTVILGHAELLQEGIEPKNELMDSVRYINDAANRAANLTRQLLTFARRHVDQPTAISPSDLLLKSTRMLRPLLGAEIEFVLLMDSDVSDIRIDPTQLEQVIMNLAINSRDAMPNGGKLVIKAYNTTNPVLNGNASLELVPGEYVCIRVEDTGTGMMPEVLEKAFDPFFTTKSDRNGTGLGLTTCFSIVRQAGGTIVPSSIPDHGSCFEVYLPAIKSLHKGDQAQDEMSRTSNRETVLVVEDEPLIRELTVKALRRGGYTVLEAENGLNALDVLAEHGATIDLLISDAVMPLMGGRELLDRVSEQYPAIRLMLASGYTETGYTPRVPAATAAAFLQKPFSSRQLLQMVADVLSQATSK